jgi:hypothetical protein
MRCSVELVMPSTVSSCSHARRTMRLVQVQRTEDIAVATMLDQRLTLNFKFELTKTQLRRQQTQQKATGRRFKVTLASERSASACPLPASEPGSTLHAVQLGSQGRHAAGYSQQATIVEARSLNSAELGTGSGNGERKHG